MSDDQDISRVHQAVKKACEQIPGAHVMEPMSVGDFFSMLKEMKMTFDKAKEKGLSKEDAFDVAIARHVDD